MTKLEDLTRAPKHALALAAVGARMAAVAALYRGYPSTDAGRRRWSLAVARLFNERPDLG